MRGGMATRREIVRVCHRLYDRGLIAGPDGNVSVRLGDRVLVTPAGMSKVDVTPDDLVEVTVEEGRQVRGHRRVSSEIAMHLRIYQRRADVQAVVHAHPPVATGFAVAGESFASCVLPEMIFQVGWVPLLPYAEPGTAGLADSFDPFLATHDAFLLANHGATTVGPDLVIAHQRMESLEHSARILLTARLLGRVNTLNAAQVAALVDARRRAVPDLPFAGCPVPSDPRSEV